MFGLGLSVWLAFVFLFFASVTDLVWKRIPNLMVGLFFLVSMVAALFSGTVVSGFASFFLVLFVGFVCWRFGLVGAGDVKLFSVIALLVPFAPSTAFVPGFYREFPAFFLLVFINSVLLSALPLSVFALTRFKKGALVRVIGSGLVSALLAFGVFSLPLGFVFQVVSQPLFFFSITRSAAVLRGCQGQIERH